MKPKLTLRDLFWLTLVVGLALGWWLDRANQSKRTQTWESRADDLAAWICRHHLGVEVEWDEDGATVVGLPTIGGY